MNREQLMKTAHEAMELFNKSMGTAYSTENTHFDFFTPQNGRKIYDDFCSKYFPKRLGGEYRTPGYFEGVRAEAFYGKPVSVIAIRTDVAGSYPFQVHVVLHELSHLYCTEHEIVGGNFYGRYCEDYAETTVEDGIINAGYAIWREAVADMMAEHIDPRCAVYSLDEVQEDIREELNYISP